MTAGNTVNESPPPNSEKVSKSKMSKSEVIGVTLDTTALLLTALRDAARLTPIPMVQNAATLALTILTTVQGARDNKGAFRRLADDAGNLVCAVALKMRRETSSEVSPELHSSLKSLITTLSEIQEFASKQLQRNIILRLIQQVSDNRVILQYRETLRQSLDVFGLKTSITIQENMATLLAQQEEILKELKEHKPDSDNLMGSQNPSVVVPHIDSSHGTFEFTSVEKDQTHVDSSQHITNSNSNNTATTITDNSSNDRSVRLFSDGRDDGVASIVTELTHRESVGPGLGGELDHGREQNVEVKREPQARQDEGVHSSYMAWATKMDGPAKLGNEKVEALPMQNQAREWSEGGQGTSGAPHIHTGQTMAQAENLGVDEYARVANVKVEAPPLGNGSKGGQERNTKNGPEALQFQSPGHISPVCTQGIDQLFKEQFGAVIPEAPQMMSSSTLGVPFRGSNNPFYQTHLPVGSGESKLHSNVALNGADDDSLGNSALQPHSRAMTMPNPLHRHFPNIKSSSGQFSFTHIGGDKNFINSSSHVTNNNSGNNTTTITTASHNDSSVRLERSAHSLPAMQNIPSGMPSKR